MKLPSNGRWIAKIALVYSSLTALFTLFGTYYVSMLTPPIQWGIEAVSSDIIVRSVRVETETVRVTFALVGGVVAHVEPDVSVSGAIQLFYGPPVLAFAIIALWPAISIGRRILATAVVFPVLAFLPAVQFSTMFVVPAVGGSDPRGALWFWYFFVSNGGLQLLAIFAALLAVGTSARVAHIWATLAIENPGSVDPSPARPGGASHGLTPHRRSRPTTRKRRTRR